MNWKDIPLPPNMQDLPTDERGFPVPFIVMHDAKGKPVFTANDDRKVYQATIQKLCGICGKPLHDDQWALGGPMSSFHPQGAYVDSPIHHDCGEYALKVCPYLAMSSYRGGDIERMAKRFEGTALFIDYTQTKERVPFFVFGKVNKWKRNGAGYVVVERPFKEIEFWRDGEQISLEEAKKTWPENCPQP